MPRKKRDAHYFGINLRLRLYTQLSSFFLFPIHMFLHILHFLFSNSFFLEIDKKDLNRNSKWTCIKACSIFVSICWCFKLKYDTSNKTVEHVVYLYHVRLQTTSGFSGLSAEMNNRLS